jgi:transposase
MGGPRITDETKRRAEEMRMEGASYRDISRELHISDTSAQKITKHIPVPNNNLVFNELLDGEVLADVYGSDGKYKISSFGRVFSLCHDKPVVITPRTEKSGLECVNITINGKRSYTHVEQLVAEAFAEKENLLEQYVWHIDGNRTNNRADNIRWSSENQSGRKPYERKNPDQPRKPKTVLSEDAKEAIRSEWLDGVMPKELAGKYDVSITTIHNIVKGLKRDFELPESETGEEWSNVPGLDKRYYVSSHGRVFTTGNGRYEARLIKLTQDRDGYLYTSFLSDDGKHITQPIHRLVAMLFCDGRSVERCVVNHKDGNKWNNHASNLEWCTPTENTRHAADVLGTIKAGNDATLRKAERVIPRDVSSRRSSLRRLTDSQVRAIRRDSRSSEKIARDYGLNKSTILSIKRGETYRDI